MYSNDSLRTLLLLAQDVLAVIMSWPSVSDTEQQIWQLHTQEVQIDTILYMIYTLHARQGFVIMVSVSGGFGALISGDRSKLYV